MAAVVLRQCPRHRAARRDQGTQVWPIDHPQHRHHRHRAASRIMFTIIITWVQGSSFSWLIIPRWICMIIIPIWSVRNVPSCYDVVNPPGRRFEGETHGHANPFRSKRFTIIILWHHIAILFENVCWIFTSYIQPNWKNPNHPPQMRTSQIQRRMRRRMESMEGPNKSEEGRSQSVRASKLEGRRRSVGKLKRWKEMAGQPVLLPLICPCLVPTSGDYSNI